MKIAPIDQRHLHGCALQLFRRLQAGKPSTQDQDSVPRCHPRPSFPSNPTPTRIILLIVRSLNLIRPRRQEVRDLSVAMIGLLFLFPMLSACANDPGSKNADLESSTVESASVHPSDSRPIVIGFLGGYVRHDDAVHTTVQVAQDLRKAYPNAIHVETFENRRQDDAHALIVNLLGARNASKLTPDQKRNAHIILYGHSWGACAVVSLARQLRNEGIPVVLTVQVDSVSKAGRDDSRIPDNVSYAVNFYQDKGFVRGQQKIVADDSSRTKILGNYYFDYSANPISCPQYPWYTRFFMRSHIEIECDQHVWHRVEDLIREQLTTSVATASNPAQGNPANSALPSNAPAAQRQPSPNRK